MAVSVSIGFDRGTLARLQRKLDAMSPRQNKRWVSRALLRGALLVQKVAAEEKILRGGSGPPVPHILTSRTGTLRRSIRVDRGGLPEAISIGTDLIYGLVHELGGRFHPPRPFLSPAADDVAPQLPDILLEEWAKEYDRA